MVKAKNISPETQLLETLDRVAKNAMGYSVLYVSMSKLKPKNRHPQFIKVVAKSFDSVVGSVSGIMFILSNGDIAILSKHITPESISQAVAKLRQGLSADPVLAAEDSDFTHVYRFPKDFMFFYDKISQMEQQTAELQSQMPPQRQVVTAGQVDYILSVLDAADIAEIVKKQSVLKIDDAGHFSTVMQEFFVAVKDLSKYFYDKIDLLANRWLFQYMTMFLDKKTLQAFPRAELTKWPSDISLNLNLSSVFSKEFVAFAKSSLKPAQKVIVEVEMMDVLNNMNLYLEAKDILHKGGHKILIDSLSPASLSMLNIEKLAPDMVKVFWEPLLSYDTQNEALKQAISLLQKDNVILAKVDGQEALKWGLSYGIRAFQGPYIDEIEVAYIRQTCPARDQCTATECLKRRRFLLGYQRGQCAYQSNLDKIL